MTRTARKGLSPPDTSELKLHLESRLGKHFGKRRSIVRLDRRLCPYTSSFRIDELDVWFEDGSEARLVLKDLSPEAMLEAARRVRPAFLYEPCREIQAYRWILPHGPQGTATWYGAVTDQNVGRYWLFLERIDGLELRHVGAFSAWERTARWIAQFHRSFPAARVRQLAQHSKFLVHDREFYWRWLERAQRFVAKDRTTQRLLDRIARRYAPVVERLTSLPKTLIHGEFYASNVLIDRHAGKLRVCPVDWEMAALAPGLTDLASLTAGWSEKHQRDLTRAYWTATAEGAGAAKGRRLPHAFLVDLDCCRLHLAVRMLGWSESWSPPPQHTHNWLVDAVRVAERLRL